MRHKGGPRLLVTDREGALYLERARVHVDGEKVVYHITDDEHAREFNIPYANLAVLFLGQGTSITQEAARLLGEEHVHLAFTGSGGSPLHMGALTTYSGTRWFRQMLDVYSDDARSQYAAAAVMRFRSNRVRSIGIKLAKRKLRARKVDGLLRACDALDQGIDRAASITSILGVEGTYTKRLYKEFATLSGLRNPEQFRRAAGGAPSASERISLINSLLDHGNYLCYGMAGAALWALGIPPHMSVFHGKTRAGGLVFDVADGFKDALVLPLAFSAANSKDSDEKARKVFRGQLIDAFDDYRAILLAIETIEAMLSSPEEAGRA